MKIEKKCNACEEVKPVEQFYKQYKRQHPTWNCYDSYCIPCRVEYGNQRRQRIKALAVAYKGGKCVDCGLKTSEFCVYDFHHEDANKEFAIGSNTKSFESIKVELDKCTLLCANCHRVRHSHRKV
jgi:hypothetical protein